MVKLFMNSGYLSVVVAVSIWALSSGVLVKNISVSGLAMYAIGAFFGIIFLLISLVARKKIKLMHVPKKILMLVFLVGLGMAINNGLYFTALKSGLVANAVLTHNLAPILVAILFAPLFLKEKITLKKIILVFISFLGLLILNIPNLGKPFDLAFIYGALSAIFYAIHVVIEKKVTQTKIDPLVTVIYKNLIPLVLYAPFAVTSIKTGISIANWWWMAVWGTLVLGVSFVLFFNGIKKIPATNASMLTYWEPIGAIILAFIFFNQPINAYVLIGGLLIVLSGFFIVKTDK